MSGGRDSHKDIYGRSERAPGAAEIGELKKASGATGRSSDVNVPETYDCFWIVARSPEGPVRF